jgi:hypothetical protein
MKKINFFVLLFVLISALSTAQTKILMEKKGGVYSIPCKVNGLP